MSGGKPKARRSPGRKSPGRKPTTSKSPRRKPTTGKSGRSPRRKPTESRGSLTSSSATPFSHAVTEKDINDAQKNVRIFSGEYRKVREQVREIWRAFEALDFDKALRLREKVKLTIDDYNALAQTEGAPDAAAEFVARRLHAHHAKCYRNMITAMNLFIEAFRKSTIYRGSKISKTNATRPDPERAPYVVFRLSAHDTRRVSVDDILEASIDTQYVQWFNAYTTMINNLELLRIMRRLIRKSRTMLERMRKAFEETKILEKMKDNIFVEVTGLEIEDSPAHEFAD